MSFRVRFVVVVAALILLSPLAFAAGGTERVVNVYSHRHYDVDRQLYAQFEEQTGINVNVIEGSADELIERLAREGDSSPADLLMTVDAGRMHRATMRGLLQPVRSPELEQMIPANLRDPDGHWYGLTQRARVIVYDRERVSPSELSSYRDLTDPRWRGRILIRSSSNIYNQSLLASMVANEGEEAARQWAAGVVANMARPPRGSDRDQMKAIAAGEGDIAVVNTYYVGLMLNSADAEERAVAQQLGVFFPDQDGRGTHINVSGAGITASASNVDNALALLRFLASEQAQLAFATANYEYPVNASVPPAPLLASWGEFRADTLSLRQLGEHNTTAVKLFDQVGWR